jgi:hypothetical protein
MSGTWTQQDSEAACAEGWDLFDAHGEMQVQRLDEAEILDGDHAAWQIIVNGCAAGSTLHVKAFALVSDHERALITANTKPA